MLEFFTTNQTREPHFILAAQQAVKIANESKKSMQMGEACYLREWTTLDDVPSYLVVPTLQEQEKTNAKTDRKLNKSLSKSSKIGQSRHDSTINPLVNPLCESTALPCIKDPESNQSKSRKRESKQRSRSLPYLNRSPSQLFIPLRSALVQTSETNDLPMKSATLSKSQREMSEATFPPQHSNRSAFSQRRSTGPNFLLSNHPVQIRSSNIHNTLSFANLHTQLLETRKTNVKTLKASASAPVLNKDLHLGETHANTGSQPLTLNSPDFQEKSDSSFFLTAVPNQNDTQDQSDKDLSPQLEISQSLSVPHLNMDKLKVDRPNISKQDRSIVEISGPPQFLPGTLFHANGKPWY